MYLSIDLGRSNTRCASSKDLNKIHKIVKFPTDTNLDKQRKLLTDAIYDVSDGEHINYTAIGVPGILDQDKKKFEVMANYPALNGLPFGSLLPDSIKNSKLIVDNDAALGGLGEAFFGAGKDYGVIAYLTISTGVGGTRIEKSKNSLSYIKAEPGHHVMSETDGIADKTGIFGTFESFCSGSYFEMRYKEKSVNVKNDKIWNEYSDHLSSGILNVLAFWNPEVVILGGGLSNSYEMFYPHLIQNLKKQSFSKIPHIVKSEHGDVCGIYGGFVLIGDRK